jgi:hypothetical protein
MSGMKDTEVQAIREMAATAKQGNNVRIGQWREDDPTRIGQSRIWACGWYAERAPDNMHRVGCRRSEREIAELIASAAKLFADIVKPKKITIHDPVN